MNNFEYKILNYWNDSDDLYVNYIITNTQTKESANVIEYYNTSDLGIDCNNASSEEIEETLYQLIRDFSGIEFNLPKISETNPLLRYIYNSVCESESNMCHIDRETWEMLKEEENFKNTDLEELAKDIKKYSLYDYITINDNEYVICGYGGLQCAFNDDTKERTDEIDR